MFFLHSFARHYAAFSGMLCSHPFLQNDYAKTMFSTKCPLLYEHVSPHSVEEILRGMNRLDCTQFSICNIITSTICGVYIYIFNRYFEMISSYCTQLGDPFQLEMKIKKHIKNPPRSRLQPVDLRLQIWLGQGDGRCSCQGDSQTLLQGHSTLRRLNHTDQGHGRQFQENLHPQVACH